MTGLLELMNQAAPGRVTDRASTRLAQAHDASHYLLDPELVANAASVDVWSQSPEPRASGRSMTPDRGHEPERTSRVRADSGRHAQALPHVTLLDDGARVRAQPGATSEQSTPVWHRTGHGWAQIRPAKRGTPSAAWWPTAPAGWTGLLHGQVTDRSRSVAVSLLNFGG